jgi:LuxR family transcriptional regulator, positive regulator of biofilm formation
MSKGNQPRNKSSFYIIGSKRFQNDLLACCLGQRIGKECCIIENLHDIFSGGLGYGDRPKLILWDCQGKDIKVIFTELKTYLRLEKCFKHVVLFNVPSMIKFTKSLMSIGVRGFFYEHDSLDNFLKGVKAVLEGKLWLSREIMENSIFEGANGNHHLTGGGKDLLSERETEILALVAVGSTNEEISDRLCISLNTVKSHLYKIFKTINAPNRVQATLWAAKNL